MGGNRKLWKNVDVVAVEMQKNILEIYKDQFPNDKIVIGDAHQYLLDHAGEFDFIWSSPPCQSHSKMVKATRHKIKKYPDMSLYQEIIFLQNFFNGMWVVENVKPYYKPLINPTLISGRHVFWTNFNVSKFEVKSPKNFINSTNVYGSEKLKDWLGIHYQGNIYYQNNHCPAQVLRNAVHPLLGLHIIQNTKIYPG